jgi:hypothetical protein
MEDEDIIHPKSTKAKKKLPVPIMSITEEPVGGVETLKRPTIARQQAWTQ